MSRLMIKSCKRVLFYTNLFSQLFCQRPLPILQMGKLRQSRSSMQSITAPQWQSELDPKICHCLDIHYRHLTQTTGGSPPRAQARFCLDSISIRHMGQRATSKTLPEEPNTSSCLPRAHRATGCCNPRHQRWQGSGTPGPPHQGVHQCHSGEGRRGQEVRLHLALPVAAMLDHPERLCPVCFRYACPSDNLFSLLPK